MLPLLAGPIPFLAVRVRGAQFLFLLDLSTQFIPAVVIVLPCSFDVPPTGPAGHPDSRLIHRQPRHVTPFVTWMDQGFSSTRSHDSEEAAMIEAHRAAGYQGTCVCDGGTGIMTSSIFCFILTWNEFLFALILSRRGRGDPCPSVWSNWFRTELRRPVGS